MRGLKIVLLINIVSGVIYTLGLVFFPRQLAGIMMAPQEAAWSIYLIPIYLSITTASWYAYREPDQNAPIIRAFVVLWVGLVITHLFNVATGIEQLNVTLPLFVFDFVMAAVILYYYIGYEKARGKGKSI
jgi:hypothetical protein